MVSGKDFPGGPLVKILVNCRGKGASGQAVHNMNLLFGLHERVGLALKPSAF